VRDGMKKAQLTRVSRYVQPDPKLNQKVHPKTIMPTPSDGDTVLQ
jgi:hypothetical protein